MTSARALGEVRQMGRPYLSVVVPAYNEQARLERGISSIASWLLAKGWPFEIIVVDDGSKDDTAGLTTALAKAHSTVRLITLARHRGKGGAVRAGVLDAHGRYVLFTDADQSTPISEVEKLLVKLEREGYDLAIASRVAPGAEVHRPHGRWSEMAKRLFRLATRIFVLSGIADTQCGFKLMRGEAAKGVFSQVTSDTVLFDIEMLVVATKQGYRIAEVPVRWVHHPGSRLPYSLQRLAGFWIELFHIKRLHRIGRSLKALT